MARRVTMEQLLERQKKLKEQMAKQKAEDDRRIARIVRKYLDVSDLDRLEKELHLLADWLKNRGRKGPEPAKQQTVTGNSGTGIS